MGPVWLTGDDTVAERPAPRLRQGAHRDGGRSTHSYTAYRWGHKWVVFVWSSFHLPSGPGRSRCWSPYIATPDWDQARTRHKTPAHLARLLLASVVRWFPERQFIFVGDTGYGTSETARFCHRYGRYSHVGEQVLWCRRLIRTAAPAHASHYVDVRVKGQNWPLPKRSWRTRPSAPASQWHGMEAVPETLRSLRAPATGTASERNWWRFDGCTFMIVPDPS